MKGSHFERTAYPNFGLKLSTLVEIPTPNTPGRYRPPIPKRTVYEPTSKSLLSESLTPLAMETVTPVPEWSAKE